MRRTGDDPERKTFLPTLLRVGIGQKWEARIESDVYAWMRQTGPDGMERAQAYAPASLGFKHHFLDADGSARPSLGAIVRVFPPSGSNSLRARRTTADVRLAADWELSARWSFNPNVGWAVDEDDQGRRFSAALMAMTLSYRPVRALELFVDTGMRRPEAKGGRSAVIYDAGLAYRMSRNVQVDLSVGARGRGSSPPRNFVAAGVSLRF